MKVKGVESVVRSRVQPVLAFLQHANTSTKKLDEKSQRLLGELAQGKRKVSKFWFEKVVLIVDAFQVYGLIWQLAQIWPWPSRWLILTRWTLIFSMDIFSLLPTGAGMGQATPAFSHWGELHGYWMYSLAFGSLPYLAIALYWTLYRYWKDNGDARYLVKAAMIENFFLSTFQVLYLPIGTTAFRLWNCQEVKNPLNPTEKFVTVSVDSSVLCNSSAHIAALGCISAGLGLPFLLGFPCLLYKRIFIVGAYAEADRHERFIQEKEISYLLNVSDDYNLLYVPQYASYRRSAMTTPLRLCFLKLVLLCIFTFGRSRYPSTDMQPFQGSLFAAVVLLFVGHRTIIAQPFRCRSTAQLCFFLDLLLAFNSLMILVSANPIKSALTVASIKVLLLSFVHTFGAILIGAHLVGTFIKKRGRQLNWPTHIHMHAIVNHVPEVTRWVDSLQTAKDVLRKTFLSSLSVKPTEELEQVVTDLHECTQEAHKREHLLHSLLYETSLAVQNALIEAKATAIMPSERIDKYIHSFESEMEQYKRKHIALQPHKLNALFKLNVVHTWHPPEQPLLQPDDTLKNPFETVNVLYSTDPELNLSIDNTPFKKMLRSTPPTESSEVPVHWSILLVHAPSSDHIIATAIQYAPPHWLLIKLPLLQQENTWVVREGWISQTGGDIDVSLLVCHDSNSLTLFHSLSPSIAIPSIDVDTVTSLLCAPTDSRLDALKQWKYLIMQWTTKFLLQNQRQPTDDDKSKIVIWYSRFYTVLHSNQN